jgi:plasmid replication initiation protein
MWTETSSKKRLYRSGANFRQRALDTAIAEINKKTDLNISLESLGAIKHRRVTHFEFFD